MSLLVLSRHAGESIQIGDNVTVRVERVVGRRVTLSVQAPPELRILRGELDERDEREAA